MSSDGTRRTRVLLVGLGATTRHALDGLAAAFDVVALIRDTDDDTSARARELGVPIRVEATRAGLERALDELAPDAVVVSSFNRIIGQDLLDRCPFVNVHYAPLPRGRGRATVNWALINGDDAAWISIHHLVAELDAGGILYQGSVPIGPRSTVTTLYEALNELQRDHLAAAVEAAIAGDPGVAQDHDAATYLCTRTPADGEIDWSASTDSIDRLVRALRPPFPSALTWLGLDRVHVEAAEPVTDAPAYEGRIPGRVVKVARAAGFVEVLTGDGVLRLDSVRLGDGEPVPAATVITSVSDTLGLRLADVADALRRAAD